MPHATVVISSADTYRASAMRQTLIRSTGGTAVNKTDKNPCPVGLSVANGFKENWKSPDLSNLLYTRIAHKAANSLNFVEKQCSFFIFD